MTNVDVIDRKSVTDVFNKFIANYNLEDPKIKLKYDHTLQVANLSNIIAQNIGADADVAWLCGMLHDIGRFEQVRKYQTFSDALSVDHAMFGADLLFRERLIDKFPLNLSNETSILVENCIRNHSVYRLPEDLSKNQKMYCDILRDADKIDIFRVHCTTPLEEIYNVTVRELRESSVSEAVKSCFMQRKTVLKRLKKTPADYVVSLICLYFELVYPISKDIAREQRYIDRLLSFESDNVDTLEWFRYMKKRIWNF